MKTIFSPNLVADVCRSSFSAHSLAIIAWVGSYQSLGRLQDPPMDSSPAARKSSWYSGYAANQNQRRQVCFFRAIYTYAVVFLESEPSHTAENTESLPGVINISRFSFLICLHFANITSQPLPLTSSGYYQQTAKKSFPSNMSATFVWEIFSPVLSGHTRRDLHEWWYGDGLWKFN